MATIYSHLADNDYSLTLESMTRNGYFPLTVMQNGQYSVMQYDDLSEVTRSISEKLMEHAGASREDAILAMEKICTYFGGGDDLEVWAEDDTAPYVLVLEDEDED